MLTTSPQTVTVSKTVTVANPKMDSVIVNQFVSIVCEIENLPNGSRLKARNTPNHETYRFSVQVTLSSSIGACTESFSEEFTGMVYDYGPEFVVALAKCWRKFADVNQKYLEFRIVLEPDLWKTIPVREREIVTTYLDVLSILRSNRELGDYERALADLPAVIGAEYRQLTTFALDDRFEVPFIDGILDQPSPRYEALLDAATRKSETGREAD